MDPITLLAHRNLLIAFAISPDPRIAGIALYFGILGRYRAPRIGARFPNSSEIWADAKLMLHSDSSPRPLSGPHGRVYNQSIIGYVVVQHFHCQCPTKFELGGRRFLSRPGSRHDRICFDHRANKGELSSGPPLGVPNLLQANGIVAAVVDVVNPMLASIVAGEVLGVIERHPLPLLLPVRFVFRNFREQPVRAHHFRYEVVVPCAMHNALALALAPCPLA